MLEIRHVTKVYKTKGGEQVRALDDVSITFGETGMVFLLGKSGSGKSTLLNVCGGLDAPDSGEIIVKGRSSKDFSGSDFDSYRNTYVGFIFQEYNILDEFSVEENIALALELQGKPKDKAAIASLLEDVDLKSYAKRKPNTLSGGQKQRVAIARALVKNPQIIMADEPTGALDSNTGKQVLDTLKKLSEKKLVIVVSHDREFAEKYGDRIIELKDGKVIRDVTKQELAPSEKTENLSVIQNNTVLVRRGSKLTDAELKRIRDIIVASDQDVLISADAEEIKTYKTAAKISADNAKECFSDIGEQPAARAYTSEESKFIRSRLPMRHAAKIGVSGIRLKPVRFAFTVLLSIIAFVMFGLFSCLMFYDADKMSSQTLVDGNVQQLFVTKEYVITEHYYSQEGEYSYSNWQKTALRQKDIDDMRAKFGDELVAAYALNTFDFSNVKSVSSDYYSTKVNFVVQAEKLSYIHGEAPQSADEIALSEYLFESICNSKVNVRIKDGDKENYEEVQIQSFEQLQQVELEIESRNTGARKYVRVSGIYRNAEIPQRYQELKGDSGSRQAASNWQYYRECENISSIAIATSAYAQFRDMLGMTDAFLYREELGANGIPVGMQFTTPPQELSQQEWNENADRMSEYTGQVVAYDLQGNPLSDTQLAGGVLIDVNAYFRAYQYYVNYVSGNIIGDGSNPELLDRYNSDSGLTDGKGDPIPYSTLSWEISNALVEGDFAKGMQYWKTLQKFFADNLPEHPFTMPDLTFLDPYEENIFAENIPVRGFVLSMQNGRRTVYCDADLMQAYKEVSIRSGGFRVIETKYQEAPDDGTPQYVSAWLPTKVNASQINDILSFVKQSDGITRYALYNELLNSVEMYNVLVATLSQVFLYVGIAMAAFSMLLLFNFIAASISAKRREIGILRAVGAKGSDVFKIFLSEAAVIVIVCILVSIILTGVISGFINDTIEKEMGMPFPLFTFGGASIGMIIGVAVGSALIATFFPVWRNARKKPVESIRSL